MFRTNVTLHTNTAAVPRFDLEQQVLSAWGQYAEHAESGLENLQVSETLGKDFRELVAQAAQTQNDKNGPAKKISLDQQARSLLEKRIMNVRTLSAETANASINDEVLSLLHKETRTAIQWDNVFDRIVQRIQNETSYFNDAATSGALQITQHGLLSRQLTSMIIPVKSPTLQKIVPQPVFISDIGVIIHPGSIPSRKEIVLSLAEVGKFPASFAKLQETVADILSWPVKERVKSFCISAAFGLATLPLNLAAKVVLFIPRTLGARWFKKNALFLRVDPVIEEVFELICTNGHHTPSVKPKSRLHRLIEQTSERVPTANPRKIEVAAQNLLELQALGCSLKEIGSLIHGAKFNEKLQIFPKLERAIAEKCQHLKITSATQRAHLLELDDAVWELSFLESRLQAMKIAREEINRAQHLGQK